MSLSKNNSYQKCSFTASLLKERKRKTTIPLQLSSSLGTSLHAVGYAEMCRMEDHQPHVVLQLQLFTPHHVLSQQYPAPADRDKRTGHHSN